MMDRTVSLPIRQIRVPEAAHGPIVRWMRRRLPSLFRMKRVCAWCTMVMQCGGLFSRGKVTHGICSGCSETMMHSVRANLPNVQPLLLAALFFVGTGLVACNRADAPAGPYRAVMHEALDVPTPVESRVASVEVIP